MPSIIHNRKSILPDGGVSISSFTSNFSMLSDGVNEYIQTNLAPAGYTAITMSTWVKLNSVGFYPMILSYGTNNENNPELRFQSDTGTVEFIRRTDNVGIIDNVNSVGTGWHNFVGISDGSNLTLYKDNVLVGTGAFPTNVNSTTSFRIGRRSDDFGGIGELNGGFDETSIWNTGFIAADVTETFNNGTPGNLSNHSKLGSLRCWSRQGESATYSGGAWTFPDASNNGVLIQSVNMEEGDRVTDVP